MKDTNIGLTVVTLDYRLPGSAVSPLQKAFLVDRAEWVEFAHISDCSTSNCRILSTCVRAVSDHLFEICFGPERGRTDRNPSARRKATV